MFPVWALLITLLATACASSPVVDDSAPLVFEKATDPPEHFRVFSPMAASGSGALSPAALKTIAKNAKGPLTIVDLRAEPHGYLNDYPITWKRSSGSADSAHDVTLQRETELISSVRGEESVSRSAASDGGSTEKVAIVSVISERELVEKNGHRYRRLAIAEAHRPSDEEIDRFLKLVRALPSDGWIHFHCADGGKRTSEFLAMYDMLRNARRDEYAAVRLRQAAALTADDDTFLRRFYEFARSHPNAEGGSWTLWNSGTKAP